MNNLISLEQAHADWKELAADLPQDDRVVLSESWNDYTDSLCKNGQLNELQYNYAPAYDEEMPNEGDFDQLEGDRDLVLSNMGFVVSGEVTYQGKALAFSASTTEAIIYGLIYSDAFLEAVGQSKRDALVELFEDYNP